MSNLIMAIIGILMVSLTSVSLLAYINIDGWRANTDGQVIAGVMGNVLAASVAHRNIHGQAPQALSDLQEAGSIDGPGVIPPGSLEAGQVVISNGLACFELPESGDRALTVAGRKIRGSKIQSECESVAKPDHRYLAVRLDGYPIP